MLPDVIDRYLRSNPGVLEDIAASAALTVSEPDRTPSAQEVIFEDPPALPAKVHGSIRSRTGEVVDFAKKDQENRKLGLAGEHFVVAVEKDRLEREGRADLAARVEHVSVAKGDGLGYDVLSFDSETGRKLLIEVKTTCLGKGAAFYVTRNEVECSEEYSEEYRLYRLFDFRSGPRLYVLRGPLSETCELAPTAFKARPVSS